MSTTPALTPEQLKALQTKSLQIVKDFAQLLQPYQMYLDHTTPAGMQNLAILSAEVRKNGMVETAETLYWATNKIVLENKLLWVPGLEPAKLKAQKLNEANIQVPQDALKDAEALRLRRLAQEAADKKSAENVKTFERIDGAIFNLRLHFASDTKDNQDRLRGYVAKQKARNADPESIFTQVKKDIERLYKEEEKSRMYL